MEGILERLKSQLEPSTEEETLQSMCLLAGNQTHTVVPLLLNKSLPWDRYLSHSSEVHPPALQTLLFSTPSP